MPPQEVENHWGYRLTAWLLHHGDQLLPFALALMAVLFLVCTALVWAQAGARWIAVFWIWREFLRGLRRRRGRGGAGGHSEAYEAYMRSSEWRRRRAQILRRDGRRCRGCGGRANHVHHRWYSSPIGEEPAWALESLCEGCHRRAHGRG